MKDIKTAKLNKTIVEVENFQTGIYLDKSRDLIESFLVGKTLFATLGFSFAMYLFFVTSTIFYAVNTQKYISKIESINNIASEVKAINIENDTTEMITLNEKKSKISFISKNSDTAISIK